MIALPMLNLAGIAVVSAAPAPAVANPVWSVSLINRRTGRIHRINGLPLLVFTRDPQQAGQDLLRNRDTTLWQVAATRLAPQARGPSLGKPSLRKPSLRKPFLRKTGRA